eukprot:CAMPEP_0198133176 /NCGR_PEP_ID=MMETSP1442-20131203/59429_1 /TAXON_ID= /ORGANISM="Craspedostauros australis, Strain CCMP3328" /LENGTH=290 /DNA_ID=CAMNT_0043794287 /DNA_START=673 /DNA_END=1545 /DNA_ORIENTATION=+
MEVPMELKPDRFGQVHPIESPKLIAAKLAEFDEELDRLPADQKTYYMLACERSPELVSSKDKLMFLRCKVFDVKSAVLRIVAYWEHRFTVFGPEKAFLPMTLDGALRDDHDVLEVGMMRCISRDASSSTSEDRRAILYADPSRLDPTRFTKEALLRSIWYSSQALLEDEEAQKKGIVFISNPRHVKLWQIDIARIRFIFGSFRNFLPIRISAVHICNPPLFSNIVIHIIRWYFGTTLRKRLCLHTGSTNTIMHRLENDHGLDRSMLPSDLDGNLILDHVGWLRDRRQRNL